MCVCVLWCCVLRLQGSPHSEPFSCGSYAGPRRPFFCLISSKRGAWPRSPESRSVLALLSPGVLSLLDSLPGKGCFPLPTALKGSGGSQGEPGPCPQLTHTGAHSSQKGGGTILLEVKSTSSPPWTLTVPHPLRHDITEPVPSGLSREPCLALACHLPAQCCGPLGCLLGHWPHSCFGERWAGCHSHPAP